MNSLKSLNKLPTMILIVVVTLTFSYCWKHRNVNTLESGNIEHAVETHQYDN